MRSSKPARLPCASSRAITSSASLPAGSSPCCWPTSSTRGRAAPVAGRLNSSASSGTPAWELPASISFTALVFAGSVASVWISARNSALLVNPSWPSSNAGVR